MLTLGAYPVDVMTVCSSDPTPPKKCPANAPPTPNAPDESQLYKILNPTRHFLSPISLGSHQSRRTKNGVRYQNPYVGHALLQPRQARKL